MTNNTSNNLESSLGQLNWLISKSSATADDQQQQKHSTSDKPHLSYAEMIRMAIEQSPNQRLSLNHIYQYISETFPYYRDDQNSSWKNSIRHNLSLNRMFVREPRDRHDPGKGSYWRIDNGALATDSNNVADSANNHNRRLYRSPAVKSSTINHPAPRINPAIQRLYGDGGAPDCSLSEEEVTDMVVVSSNNQQQSMIDSPSTSVANNDQIDCQPLLSPDTVNLAASFRDLYDQLFNGSINDSSMTSDQMRTDWLKQSLEAAGIVTSFDNGGSVLTASANTGDMHNLTMIADIDGKDMHLWLTTDCYKEQLASSWRDFLHKSVTMSQSQPTAPLSPIIVDDENDIDIDFDWDSLINKD